MQKLEAQKVFPYVAWITVIMFSIFTYNLVRELKVSVQELEAQTNYTQSSLHSLGV